jgi:hypothetical protein
MESLNRKALIAFLVLLILDLLVRVWASRDPTEPNGVEHLSLDPAQVLTIEITKGKEHLVLERTVQGFARLAKAMREGQGQEQGQGQSQVQGQNQGLSLDQGPGQAQGQVQGHAQGSDPGPGNRPALLSVHPSPLTAQQTQKVEGFLQRICSMVRESLEGVPDAKDSTYGLDPEHAVSIRLQWNGTGNDRKTPLQVRFGAVLPLNQMYVYASFEDKPGLYKVLKTYKETAVTLLHDLR